MAEILMWLGVAVLMGGPFGAAFDGLTFALLTPTQTSPDRPGDREARGFTRRAMKLEVLSVGIGAAFLMTGIAIYLTV